MPAGGGYDPTLLPGPGGGYMLDDAVSAYDGVLAEFGKSQAALGFEYVDLLLLHYPSLPSSDLEGTGKQGLSGAAGADSCPCHFCAGFTCYLKV
eukprot:SAG22_NODE_767_length_7375_cov_24.094055_5_plen_94_part_00